MRAFIAGNVDASPYGDDLAIALQRFNNLSLLQWGMRGGRRKYVIILSGRSATTKASNASPGKNSFLPSIQPVSAIASAVAG
jgi:hypothetical protein